MAWVECSKQEYMAAVNSGDNTVRSDSDQTIWQTRHGAPVARSSKGYMPKNEPEAFYVWR